MGSMVSRRQKALSREEIEKISKTYHEYRNINGQILEEEGFAKIATIEQVKEKDYKLTPGNYVGTAQIENDDMPFEEKMEDLKNTLRVYQY
jgi:type I restriction enzyme M protein